MNRQTHLFLIAILALSLGLPAVAMEKSTKLGQQLIKAAKNGDLEKLNSLIKKSAPVNEKDRYGWTALSHAAEHGHQLCCKTLLECGALVNEKDNDGKTALMRAALRGHQECCEMLIQSRALVNEKDVDGKTALILTARYSYDQSCCKTLLECGASVNEKDNRGQTALIHAAECGHQLCCKTLLECGASADEKDNRGRTALMHAAGKNNQPCCEILLKYGASVNEKDYQGMTALIHGTRYEHHESYSAIIQVMLGIWDVHLDQAYATLFCMKEIQPRPDDRIFSDIMEPIVQRLCFAQKMDKDAVLAEVNKLMNTRSKRALIKTYFNEVKK